jgi:hypothetical protein
MIKFRTQVLNAFDERRCPIFLCETSDLFTVAHCKKIRFALN